MRVPCSGSSGAGPSSYSVKIGDQLFSDLVWTYPDPIPECPKIKGYLCFFNEQVDEIRVDGVAVARPVTPWSKDWKENAATVPDNRGPVVRPLIISRPGVERRGRKYRRPR